jgi:hypothetical protein
MSAALSDLGLEPDIPPYSHVNIDPGFLKRSEVQAFSAIVAGPVVVEVELGLIDTDTTQGLPPNEALRGLLCASRCLD